MQKLDLLVIPEDAASSVYEYSLNANCSLCGSSFFQYGECLNSQENGVFIEF